MASARRFSRQLFQLKKVTIDRTEGIRLTSGAVSAEVRPTLAIAVCPSPARSVDRYQYIPRTPDEAYAETAAHLYAWYGFLRHQLRIAQA